MKELVYGTLKVGDTIIVTKALRALIHQVTGKWAGEKMTVFDVGCPHERLLTKKYTSLLQELDGEKVYNSEYETVTKVDPRPLILSGESNKVKRVTLFWDVIDNFNYVEKDKPAKKGRPTKVTLDLNKVDNEIIKLLKEKGLI